MHANVKWALDFSKFLVDDLFEIADTFEDGPNDPTAWSQAGK